MIQVVSAKADSCNEVHTDEVSCDSQVDHTERRPAAAPPTCNTVADTAGLQSAMFDCTTEAIIQRRTKQHSRSTSLLGVKQTRRAARPDPVPEATAHTFNSHSALEMSRKLPVKRANELREFADEEKQSRIISCWYRA